MDLDETTASHTGTTRLGRVLGGEGGGDETLDAIPQTLRRPLSCGVPTVAYAQGRCSLYNLFYLAYEKGFAAETLNSKLYKDY